MHCLSFAPLQLFSSLCDKHRTGTVGTAQEQNAEGKT